MHITEVEPYLCFAGWRNWVLVKVTTDTGITGWGEATLEMHERSVESAVREVRGYLIGQDPFSIERLWEVMVRGDPWQGGPVRLSAASAVEAALWDIVGQALGTPIYNCLGGRYRDRIRCYANGWYFGAHHLDDLVRRAVAMVEQGFDALKWNPFGLRLKSNPYDVTDARAARQNFREAVKCVEAVRRAVGDDADLLIELHGKLAPYEAIEFMHAIEPYEPFFYEEPLPVENQDALARVHDAVRTPLAWGERRFTRHGFRALLEQEMVDIIQPDLCHAGGILEGKKIAAMADTWYVPIAPHNPNGPVSTAMCLQLAACVPNFLILELFVPDVSWREALLVEPLHLEKGYLYVPDRPGLGIRVNESVLAAHPYERVNAARVVAQGLAGY